MKFCELLPLKAEVSFVSFSIFLHSRCLHVIHLKCGFFFPIRIDGIAGTVVSISLYVGIIMYYGSQTVCSSERRLEDDINRLSH
jgi:hypothetical protein